MKQIVVPMNTVPEDMMVHTYIDKLHGVSHRFKDMPIKNKPDPAIKFKPVNFNHEAALASCEEAAAMHGWYGFISHFTNTDDILNDRTSYYGGFSITHNPDLWYSVPTHASALGEPRYNLNDFFMTDLGRKIWVDLEQTLLSPQFYKIVYAGGLLAGKAFLLKHGLITGEERFNWDQPFIKKSRMNRNSYLDTYGFRYITPAGRHGYHGDLLRRVKRSIVRSRVAWINGAEYQEKAADYMWHVDEPVLMNLRINIPLSPQDGYAFEIKDRYKGQFEEGFAYIWDTEVLHRVYAERPTNTRRANMVIGVSSWFDYDDERKAYVSNEFYGELHPFDMLVDGHVIGPVEVHS